MHSQDQPETVQLLRAYIGAQQQEGGGTGPTFPGRCRFPYVLCLAGGGLTWIGWRVRFGGDGASVPAYGL